MHASMNVIHPCTAPMDPWPAKRTVHAPTSPTAAAEPAGMHYEVKPAKVCDGHTLSTQTVHAADCNSCLSSPVQGCH